MSVYALKDIALHAGDRVRWTAGDPDRALLNAQLARVDHVRAQSITLTSLANGKQHALERGDRMLERLDLAYALNVHTAQRVTTDHGIVMMSAREGVLASQSTFLVAVTRIADKAAPGRRQRPRPGTHGALQPRRKNRRSRRHQM